MKTPEEQLDTLISQLKASQNREDFSSWPAELSELGPAARALAGIRRRPLPEPSRKRRYLAYLPKPERVLVSWFHLSRFATVSLSLLLVVAATAGTAYAAVQSLPGQTLFAVKRTAEQIHLSLASNAVEKANLQVRYANKRLQEAEVIFTKKANPKLEVAALRELKAQTEAALSDVKQVVKETAPSEAAPHPVVSSLADVTSKQQVLLKTIEPQTEPTGEIKDEVAEIKNTLAVAAALTDVTQAPSSSTSSLAITGTLTEVTEQTLTVDDTALLLTEQTKVTFEAATAASGSPSGLATGSPVSVTARRTSDGLVAEEVTVLTGTEPGGGAIKGDSTTTTSTVPSAPRPTTTAPSAESSDVVLPSKAVGSYLIEDPSPQYVP